MNRSFVLFLFAAVMLAFIFSADAATKTKTKSKTKTVTKKTKSKSKSKSKTVTKKVTKSKSKTKSVKKTKTPTKAPTAPSAPVTNGTNDYVVNLSVDATATAANNLKDQIETQLEKDLVATAVAISAFQHGKFSIQAVKASAIVADARLTSTAAKNLLTGASYRLANLKVTAVDVVAADSPSSARRLGVGLIGAVVGTLVAMIALVF